MTVTVNMEFTSEIYSQIEEECLNGGLKIGDYFVSLHQKNIYSRITSGSNCAEIEQEKPEEKKQKKKLK